MPPSPVQGTGHSIYALRFKPASAQASRFSTVPAAAARMSSADAPGPSETAPTRLSRSAMKTSAETANSPAPITSAVEMVRSIVAGMAETSADEQVVTVVGTITAVIRATVGAVTGIADADRITWTGARTRVRTTTEQKC